MTQTWVSSFHRAGSTSQQVSVPTFNPGAGLYAAPQSVVLSCATPNATIFYTLDGSTPTPASLVYSSPIAVNANEIINAIATAVSYSPSSLATASYAIQAAAPTFSPGSGSYNNSVTVTINALGAAIYYTTDGSTPTYPISGTTQFYASPITDNTPGTSTLNAIAVVPGFATSAVGSATYIVTQLQVATPTFSPNTGTYSTDQNITISDATSGVSIYYTLDGSTPTTSSIPYVGSLIVNASGILKAIAVRSGYTDSNVGSATYTMQDAAPTFSPAAGSYSGSVGVTVSSVSPRATLYVTQDGSTPTTSSALYPNGQSFSITASETIKAIAVTAGYSQSAVGSAAYVITAASSGLPNLPITYYVGIGGAQPSNYSSAAWRQTAAKSNFILYQDYVGIEGSMGGQTLSSSMADLKSRAVAMGNTNCQTGIYQIPQSFSTSGDTRVSLFNACNTNNWWLRSSWPSGSINGGGGIGYDSCMTAILSGSNTTPITALASGGWANGLDFCQAAALYEFNYVINGTPIDGSAAANPNCDFIFHDNQFNLTRSNGCWLDTTTSYAGGDATISPYLQAGQKRVIDKWRSLCPTAGSGKTMRQHGNCDWNASSSSVYAPACIGLYDGCLAEIMMGEEYAAFTYASPNTMLQRMAAYKANLTKSSYPLCVFEVYGGPCDGVSWPSQTSQSGWTGTFAQSTTSPTNSGGNAHQTGTFWQAARYSLGLALCGGWAHFIAMGSAPSGNVYDYLPGWLDEYNKSGAQWNWLGAPIDPELTGVPATDTANGTLLSNGVYRRRFTNATVWANPLGNGTQTFSASGHALSNGGFSDPAINNGAAFSSLILYDADGRITLP